uniref:Uncharacterized protein n=1 Tax=Triticum urartu TaxID=4572 RepID=A0A8R7V0C1_TRIUA
MARQIAHNSAQILVLLPIIHSISSFYHQPPLAQCSSHKSGCPTSLQNLDICYDNLPCCALLG